MSAIHRDYSPVTSDYSLIKHERARELRQSMTPAERRLWHILKGERLQGLHFRRQQAILGFIADFYCHKARLIVEVDGCVHAITRAADQQRDAILSSAGFTILRFTNEEIASSLLFVRSTILNEAKRTLPRAFDSI